MTQPRSQLSALSPAALSPAALSPAALSPAALSPALGVSRPLRAALAALICAAPGARAALAAPDGARAPEHLRVSRVLLLSDRAEVTREGEARCARAGEGVAARFERLPALADLKTLRAEVDGGAEVVGVSVTPAVALEVEATLTERARLKELEGTLARLGAAQRGAQRDRERAQDELRLLSEQAQLTLNATSAALAEGRAQPKLLEAALSDLYARREALEREQVERELSIAARAQEAAAARAEREELLADVGGRGGAALPGAEVSLKCSGLGVVRARLSYVTAGAQWTPEYSAHVRPATGELGDARVEWRVAAVVRQATGEDWVDAQVTLSTAQPRLGDRAPRPAPLRVTGYADGVPKVLSQRERAHVELAAGDAPQEPAAEGVEDRGQSFALKAPERLTVRADGRPYWLPISESEARGEVTLEATPKLSPYVYRVARFKSPARHPLPAGEVQVSLSGVHLGAARLEAVGEGEPVELTLGVEGRLRLSRRPLSSEDVKGGLFSSDRALTRAARVELVSVASAPLRVTLTENIPLSEAEEVKVTLDRERTTKGFKLDAARGFLTWEVKVKPRATRALDLVYRVDLPESWTLR